MFAPPSSFLLPGHLDPSAWADRSRPAVLSDLGPRPPPSPQPPQGSRSLGSIHRALPAASFSYTHGWDLCRPLPFPADAGSYCLGPCVGQTPVQTALHNAVPKDLASPKGPCRRRPEFAGVSPGPPPKDPPLRATTLRRQPCHPRLPGGGVVCTPPSCPCHRRPLYSPMSRRSAVFGTLRTLPCGSAGRGGPATCPPPTSAQ